MHVHQHTRSHICLRCYRGEDGARRNFLTERKKLLYMSRFLPAWGVSEFAFQQRESKGRRKANQKRGVFFFLFLIPALLRRLFSSRKICVSVTQPLQSLETPLQTMWQHQLNSQLSWGRDTPLWENIVTWQRLQVCTRVFVCLCMPLCVCAGLCMGVRET